MSNFDGLINDAFKSLHVDAITEVIRGCSVSCTLIYGVTLYNDCPNCIFDPIGNKSSNRWQSGGSMYFTVGNCPMCAGSGKIPDEQTEDIELCVFYDYRDWYNLSSNVKSPEGFAQTMSAFSTYESLVQAKEIIIDTDINTNVRQRFEKHGEPEPCGMGDASFIFTMWKRIENR